MKYIRITLILAMLSMYIGAFVVLPKLMLYTKPHPFICILMIGGIAYCFASMTITVTQYYKEQ